MTYSQLREAALALNGALVIIAMTVAVFHPPQPAAPWIATICALNFLALVALDYVPRKE